MRRSRSKQNMHLFFHAMGLTLLIGTLLVLLVSILLPSRSFSEKENRVLASRPPLGLEQLASGDYEKQYETYVNDQFPLRDLWVTVKAGTDRLLGKTDANGVWLGRSGYLMEQFQAPAQERFDATVKSMTDFAARHTDLKEYALIAPTAANILSDKLPAFAPAQDQNVWLDSLSSSLTDAGVSCIDVRDVFREHRDEGLYYHTDHHWTSLGAYYAYREASGALGINTGDVQFERLPVSRSFQGTLSAKSGFRSGEKDELDVYLPTGSATPSYVVNYVDKQKKSGSLYDTAKLDTRDKYALFFGGNHAQVRISTPSAPDRTLLVLKDSYANSFVPFLVPYFRSIVMVDPRYYYGDLDELIQVEGIQEVLYLYNANTFFSDTSLELALTPQEETETEG